MRSFVSAVLLALVGVVVAAEPVPEPFNARDLWEMQRISGPVASPDGSTVAYVSETRPHAHVILACLYSG